MPSGNKRYKLQVCSSVYELLLPPGIKGLKTTLLSFLLFISVTDCKQYNTTFSLVYKRGSRYLFKDSMVPFFALVALCLWYFLSVGGTRGTRDRQHSSTIEIAVLHLKTFPVVVGNGVTFLIFRHSTMCGLILFFIIAFFLWIDTII